MTVTKTNLYREIAQGKTHRETATAIYHYLTNHKDELPDDETITGLTFRLDGTETAIHIMTFATDFSIFPAIVNQWHIDNDYSPSWGQYNGVVVNRGHITTKADPEAAIERIRLVVMRTIRYRDKLAARRASRAA